MIKNNPIQVIKAEAGRVEIKILGIHYVFVYDGNAIIIASKFKPDSRIYDPKALRIPTNLLNQACQQAAAILKDKHQRQKRQTALLSNNSEIF